MDIKAAADAIRADLDGVGVTATIDYRDLTVPGVLIVPDTAAYNRLSDDAGNIVFRLVAVAGTADAGTALVQLGALLDQCQQIADLTEIEFTTYSNPNIGADPLPCFTAAITSEWKR